MLDLKPYIEDKEKRLKKQLKSFKNLKVTIV